MTTTTLMTTVTTMPRKRKEPPTEDRLAVLPGMGTSMLMGGETTDERRERELEDILLELGGDTRVKVYHIVEGRPVYAGEVPAEGFTLDTLLDAFGGGDKALTFFQGKEKKDTARVSLDPTVPIKSPRSTGRGGAPGATSPGFGDMAALIAAMAQSSMSSTQMMHTMMMASQGQMTTMLNAMTAMMAANRGADPMDMAVKIGELMKSNATGSGAKELLEVFEKGMSIRDKLGGDGDGDSTLEIASKGLDIVGKLVAAQPPTNGHRPALMAPNTSSGRLPNAPARVPVSPPPPGIGDAPAAPPSQDRLWVAAARPSFPLLSLSIGNVKPETAVDVLADRMTEDAFDDLIDDIEAGTPDDFIARFEGYFAVTVRDDATRQWFRELLTAILATVEPDGAEGDEPGE